MNPLDIITIGMKIFDKIIPDPAQKAQAQLDLLKLQQNGELAQLTAETDLAKGQLEVNTEEAKSTNWFVAGARPFIMWTCGGALFSQYILRPWIQWACILLNHPIPPLPGIDDQLWQLMGGMLGLGGMRTYEKFKGVEGNR